MAKKIDTIDVEGSPFFEQHAINLVGAFTPTLFHPLWFSQQKLIRQEEAEKAKIAIIHTEITRFSLDWVQVEVVSDRFVVSTIQEASYEEIRDLVLGILKVLPHSPVRMIGINLNQHFKTASEKIWHEIGHVLAPKKVWKDVLENPGMKNIVIEGKRVASFPGYTRITVSPSLREKYAVSVDVNDHYEDAQKLDSLKVLENWKSSVDGSREKIKTLLKNIAGKK